MRGDWGDIVRSALLISVGAGVIAMSIASWWFLLLAPVAIALRIHPWKNVFRR